MKLLDTTVIEGTTTSDTVAENETLFFLPSEFAPKFLSLYQQFRAIPKEEQTAVDFDR